MMCFFMLGFFMQEHVRKKVSIIEKKRTCGSTSLKIISGFLLTYGFDNIQILQAQWVIPGGSHRKSGGRRLWQLRIIISRSGWSWWGWRWHHSGGCCRCRVQRVAIWMDGGGYNGNVAGADHRLVSEIRLPQIVGEGVLFVSAPHPIKFFILGIYDLCVFCIFTNKITQLTLHPSFLVLLPFKLNFITGSR